MKGHFEFRYVDVGEYRVPVSVPGFTEIAGRVTVLRVSARLITVRLSYQF